MSEKEKNKLLSWSQRLLKRRKQDEALSSEDSSASYEVLETKSVEKQRQKIIKQAQKHRLTFISTNQRIVTTSLLVLLCATLFFASFTYWRLYQVQDYSDFSYNVTRILPLPVARVGSSFVMYEDYLRELKRQVHYFEHQQQIDLSQDDGQNLITLAELKNLAMQRAVTRIYVRKLAQEYDIEPVSQEEINQRLEDLKKQSKINKDGELEDVLLTYWGLSLSEYRKVVEDIILQEKVTRSLDANEEFIQSLERGADGSGALVGGAQERAEDIRRLLNTGGDFSALAREFSEDINTANRGGEYNFLISADSQQEHPLVVEAIFATPVGRYSDIIDTGQRLEIVKVLDDENDGPRRAAHITIFYISLSEMLKELEAEHKPTIYIEGVEYIPNVSGG